MRTTRKSQRMKSVVFKKVNWKKFLPGPVIGVDEVGRGCLAGPVVAGAALLIGQEGLTDLTDSKLLSESQRESLAKIIQEHHLVGIGFASVEEIEKLNILHASLLAMRRAVQDLETKTQHKCGHLLVDGIFKVPGLECQQTPLVKGDLRAAPISAASIVAKVFRDQWMKSIGAEFPNYGFEVHKGYATPQHKKAIEEFGICRWHRKTFAGLGNSLLGQEP